MEVNLITINNYKQCAMGIVKSKGKELPTQDKIVSWYSFGQ